MSTIRMLAISAALAVCATPALAAETWTDPSGSFTIANPEKWKMELMSAPNSPVSQYFGGVGSHECIFSFIPRSDTATRAAKDVKKAFANPIGETMWSQALGNIGAGGLPPKVVNASVSENAGWPVQLATLEGKDGPVIAAIHGRPGFEVRSHCVSLDGKDRSTMFTEIVKTIASPKDAAWTAADAKADADAAAKAAAEQEAAAAAAAAAKGGKKPKKEKKPKAEGAN